MGAREESLASYLYLSKVFLCMTLALCSDLFFGGFLVCPLVLILLIDFWLALVIEYCLFFG